MKEVGKTHVLKPIQSSVDGNRGGGAELGLSGGGEYDLNGNRSIRHSEIGGSFYMIF